MEKKISEIYWNLIKLLNIFIIRQIYISNEAEPKEKLWKYRPSHK